MSFIDAAGKLIKQGAAGTIEYFSAGSKDPGDPRNASQIPILEPTVTGMYKLGQAVSDILPISHRLYVPSLEASAQKMALNSASINKKLDINDPSNAMEVVARMAPMLAGPGGEIKGMQHVAGKYLSNAAKTVAKTGLEFSLPGNQGGIKTALAAGGIGVGLNEVADAVDNRDSYHGVADMMKQGVVQPHLKQKPFGDYLTPESAQIYNTAVDQGDVETQDQIRTQVMGLQQEDAKKSYLPPTPFWDTPEAKEAVVLGAGAVAGFFGAKALARTKSSLMGSTTLAGQATTSHLSDISTKATQGFIQNDHMLRDSSARMTGDKGKWFGNSGPLDQWLAKLDSVTNPAIHSKQQHFAMTGELPNSATTVKPIGPMLEGIQTGLQPAEKDLLTDGLLAGTALDDYKRFGVQTSFTHDRQGNPVSQADVQHIFDLVQNDPKLRPIADDVRGHYRNQLDYMKEHGIISQDQYQGFITAGPNFVHMSKDEAPDTVRSLWSRGDNGKIAGDRRASMLGSRSQNEGGGVSAGAAADPLAELPTQWSRLIREVEIHNVKKLWLEQASSSPELKDWVKQLPIGAKPEGNPAQIHTVFENGMEHNFFVKDPSLAEALNFQPFAQSNALSAAGNFFRRNFEYFTTGAGNPFFAPVAASYDTFTGMALKPKGYNLGVLNEILAHINPKLSIGNLDPTWIASAPIGAARHGWDSLVGSMGTGLASELEAGSGPVLNALGPTVTQNMATKLSQMYAASIKSQMDELGIANANIFTSNRPDRVAPGLSEIAPKFATGVAAKAFRESLQGDHSLAQQMLAGSHYAFESVRAAPLARLYSGVLKSIHEGFRYQAFATNAPKIVDPASAELIASQTRRVAADIGQKGAGELAQTGINGLAYANAGLQSLAEVARKFRAAPAHFITNVMTSLLGLTSLYYGPALISKEHQEEMTKRTEEQRMAAFKTFGGLEVKVPPELRPIWGSMIAVLDDASGLNAGNFNPNFADAIQSWLDNGLSEPGQQDFQQNIKEGLWGAAPATWGSNPVLNAVMAASSGLDISYSRYTGSPQTVKPQQIDPLGGEGEFVDSAISASWQKAIEDIGGTMFGGYLKAGLDVQRAIKDDDHTLDQGLKVAASRIVDTAAAQTGPASVMFGDYERKQSANDGEMKLYQKKKIGFQKAVDISNKDILTPFTDGKDPRSANMSMLDPLDLAKNQKLVGTSLVPIGAIAAQILKATQPIDNQITDIKKQIDEVSNQKATTVEERNKQINALIAKRRTWIVAQNNYFRMGEDAVRQQIGDPTFTFQDFGQHFDRYEKRPWPSPPPVQQPSVDGSPPTSP